MKRLLFTLTLIWGFQMLTFSQVDYFKIRNYKTDVALHFNGLSQSSVLLSEYGNINYSSGSQKARYLYQGQELDIDLGIYLFPSRIYSAKEKRFFQPDPKSQYHSPYLFVNANPVNIVDPNGQQGKILFLYGEDHDLPRGFNDYTASAIEAAGKDAYVYPLSQFANGEIGDLPEWNGEVFINAHMGLDEGEEIEAEVANNAKDLKIKPSSEIAGLPEPYDGRNATFLDARGVGRKLRKIGKTPLKRVTLGGCEGSFAAKRIAVGFEGEHLPNAPNRAIFTGLKEGRSISFPPRELSKEFRVETFPEGREVFETFEDVEGPNGLEERYTGSEYLDELGEYRMSNQAVGAEAEGFIHGRVPQPLRNDFEAFGRSFY